VKIVEDEGRLMPNTVSEKGSLYPPGIPLTTFLSSWDIDASLVREGCFPLPPPILDCFFLNTLDRGLSIVEAEEPETNDGVLANSGTSSLGRREDGIWKVGLEVVRVGTAEVIGTVGVVLPWRDRTATEGFGAGARWPAVRLPGYTCSSLAGCFFCNLAAGN
jgi:hypothetical protein